MARPPVLSLALPSETGRVLSIQSHTVQGYVGNKSAVFPLQLLGYDVDPIKFCGSSQTTPGKQLSKSFFQSDAWNMLLGYTKISTRYPTFKGQVLNGEQLWDLIEGLQANNLLFYTHLLTGGLMDVLARVLQDTCWLLLIWLHVAYQSSRQDGWSFHILKTHCPYGDLIGQCATCYAAIHGYIGSVSFLGNGFKELLISFGPLTLNLYMFGDPVLGDEGKLYVPMELVSVYREKVVLTSIHIDGNLLLIGSHQKAKGQSPKQFKIAILKIPAYFTGTGDLMTSPVAWMEPIDILMTLTKAAEFWLCLACRVEAALRYLRKNMDPDAALQLVKEGATVLLLDVPQSTLIGIDTQMFSSGPNFKGIKMIPPGVHFVYYSSSNREGNAFSPIIGFFIVASHSEVIVRKWDQKEERFVKLSEEDVSPKGSFSWFAFSPTSLMFPMDNAVLIGFVLQFAELRTLVLYLDEERYGQAVRRLEFDRQLGPYMLNHYGDWRHLSNYITKAIIERLEPIGGEISVSSEPDSISNIPKTAMEKALAEQLRNSTFSRPVEKSERPVEKSERKGCYFTPIPRLIKHKGLSGHDLTKMNLDKTQILETIIAKEYGGNENSLLGELQFSFIAFLMGQSLEAYLQWKLIASLFLGCTEAPLHTRSQLFTKLKFGFQKDDKNADIAEKGVMALLDESWLSDDSFLHILCKDFFSLLLEVPVIDGDLLSWTRKLKDLLEDSLGWDFEPNNTADELNFEDDEYAPVVEMIDDPGHSGMDTS
nr:protein AAR2 homolog [Ipomoea batatas]